MKTILLPGLAVVTALAGCAQPPETIVPVYVSEVPYMSWTCPQLASESIRLQQVLAMASAQQQSAATGDTVGMLFVGLPVSSMSGGNIAPQISLYKGQQEAVGRAMVVRQCLAPPPPGAYAP